MFGFSTVKASGRLETAKLMSAMRKYGHSAQIFSRRVKSTLSYPSSRSYEPAGSARKRSSAEYARCAKTGRHESKRG